MSSALVRQRTETMAAYLDEAARERRLEDLSSKLGAEVVVVGHSHQGRPIRAAVVPPSSETSETSSPSSSSLSTQGPTVWVNGNLHGVEWIGGLCALGILEALGEPRGRALRERATVVVTPCLNPDGFSATTQSGGAASLKALRTNARGVDLNRNFPRPDRPEVEAWAPSSLSLAVSGSSDPRRATWRGPHPLSEPEARAVDGLLQRYRPHAVVSFHSFMGTLIPPKVTTWRDARTYRRLARAFRRGQLHHRYPTLMGAPVDVFTGELEDHAHHVHGAWALTVEVFPVWRSFREHLVAPSLFARFNPREPQPVVDDAVFGTFAFLLAALAEPRVDSR